MVSLPEGLPSTLSGYPEKDVSKLWTAVRKIYPSEAEALAACQRAPAMLIPTINSPKKIAETNQLLRKRLGNDRAAECLRKNPNFLTMSYRLYADMTDDDILRAADTNDFIETNRPVVLAAIALLFAAILAASAEGAALRSS